MKNAFLAPVSSQIIHQCIERCVSKAMSNCYPCQTFIPLLEHLQWIKHNTQYIFTSILTCSLVCMCNFSMKTYVVRCSKYSRTQHDSTKLSLHGKGKVSLTQYTICLAIFRALQSNYFPCIEAYMDPRTLDFLTMVY